MMSDIAKSGFITEEQVVSEFNNWKESTITPQWFKQIKISDIKHVAAHTTRSLGKNTKADVLVTINGTQIGISVKKFKASFNQLDKRRIDSYEEMWNIPDNVSTILRKYCGEEGFRPIDHKRTNVRDTRRYFLNELDQSEQRDLLEFFTRCQRQIVNDILQGYQEPKADYMLVVQKNGDGLERSKIVDINTVIEYVLGPVHITKKGSLKMGKITVQRKGGDAGKSSAQMLQFKFSPQDVLDLNYDLV